MTKPSRALTTRGRCALLALAAIFAADVAAAVDVRYLAFGDSVTEAWGFDEDCECNGHECRQACGYPRRLKRLLAEVGVDAGVINEGSSGEKTAEGVTRIDRLLGPSYDVLLLMEGTNDISQLFYSPETTEFNLSEMARKAAVKGIETVHATVIPRSPQARRDPENVLNSELAGRVRDLAFGGGRRLADPFEVFASTPDVFDDFYSETTTGDPVGHPNARGFDLLAEVFFNALREIDDVAPVVGHVEPPYGAVAVGPLSPVLVRLYDFGVGLDTSASALLLNGEPVAFQSASGNNWQDLVYQPASALPAEVTVRVSGRDLAANAMDREVSRFTVDLEAPGPCVADATTLCIDRQVGDARFQLTLAWETALNGGQAGAAEAIALAPIGLRRGGLFSFFDRENPEVLVKVLDGCPINGHFWVFVAPTTTLGYTLRVVDTLAAQQGAAEFEFVVTNPDGRDAPPVSDTSAFATCDYGAAPQAAALYAP